MKPYFSRRILLASQSPRRQQLIADSGFFMEVIRIDVEEDFHPHLKAEHIPEYLAQKKSRAYTEAIPENALLVTADTIVWLKDEVLNKPKDIVDARDMLRRLSGNKHTVYTGVCVRSDAKEITFSEATDVHFNTLSDDMIDHYLSEYRPLDKAGAYGIQEFIGYVGIRSITGCYYNVMGFPVSRFINEIERI